MKSTSTKQSSIFSLIFGDENFHISQSSPARARSRPASAWAEVHLPAVRAKSEWGLVASPLTASGPHHHPRLPSSGWWHPTRGRQTNEAIGPSSQGKLHGHIPKTIPDFIANIMSSTMFHWGSYMRPFMIPSNVLCEPGTPQHAKLQAEKKLYHQVSLTLRRCINTSWFIGFPMGNNHPP